MGAALVGCGSLSQRGILPHLSLPDARERVRMAAVVDAVEERARQSAERCGVPAYFTEVGSMLADADVDLVRLCLAPPGWIAERRNREVTQWLVSPLLFSC